MQVANADIERIKNVSINEELVKLAKDAFVAKFVGLGETKFAEYFQKQWSPKKFTYAEVNSLLVSETPQDTMGVCVPPQSNAIERQNLTQKMVTYPAKRTSMPVPVTVNPLCLLRLRCVLFILAAEELEAAVFDSIL